MILIHSQSPFPPSFLGNGSSPGILHGLPWMEIRSVLVVGGDSNKLAALISSPAEVTVRSEIPKGTETFDLVVLGAPLHHFFIELEAIANLVKPGGYFCVGIETRGLRGWMTHKGIQAFARWKTLKNRPPHFREQAASLAAYGFHTAEIYGCISDRRLRRALYPLGDHVLRASLSEIVEPSITYFGLLRSYLSNLRYFRSNFEDEALIVARKGSDKRRILWSQRKSLIQLCRREKILLIEFEGTLPKRVEKFALNSAMQERLSSEMALLRAFQSASENPGGLWPVPLKEEGFGYKYTTGYSIGQNLLPPHFDIDTFCSNFANLCTYYGDWAQNFRALELPASVEERIPLPDLKHSLIASGCSQKKILKGLESGYVRQYQERQGGGLSHGDLCISNILITENGEFRIIDWENWSQLGLASVDLIQLFFDVSEDLQILPERTRGPARLKIREVLLRHLAKQGLNAEEQVELFCLALALKCFRQAGQEGEESKLSNSIALLCEQNF